MVMASASSSSIFFKAHIRFWPWSPFKLPLWQEGYEAGKQDERKACAKVCADWSDYTKGIAPTLAEAIRARGQA